MKYLEELEKKVLHIITHNKSLLSRCDELSKEVHRLEQNLIASELLYREQSMIARALVIEKEATQAMVETLIVDIEALEKTL